VHTLSCLFSLWSFIRGEQLSYGSLSSIMDLVQGKVLLFGSLNYLKRELRSGCFMPEVIFPITD
jgi:hypothetical protein